MTRGKAEKLAERAVDRWGGRMMMEVERSRKVRGRKERRR